MNPCRAWVWLVCLVALLAAACATTHDENEVSTIPWNRPESWEGMGALGGFGGMGYGRR